MNFFSLYKRAFLYKVKKKINIDHNSFNSGSTLEDFFVFYGTDKANEWKKQKKNGHGYSEFYEKHLKKIKNNNINILEIGSYSGASAASFSKYFPNSKVFCMDVNISTFKYFSKQIEVFGLDATNLKSKKKLLKKLNLQSDKPFFDIIIDDASHILSDILSCFKNYLNLLKPNGFYIIEDYNHPKYYAHLHDVKDIMIDDLIVKISEKKNFDSKIIKQAEQSYIFDKIKTLNFYKGNLNDSDIVFFETR